MVLIINHFQRSLALLASQFRGEKRNGELTNLQKVIKALVRSLQEAEDVNYELKTQRWLSVALGQQLNELGIILGLLRLDGESDSDYRERLQFQIFINTSNGTPEDVIKTLKFLTNASKIGYFEIYPAFFQMETDGLKFPIPANQLNDAIFSVSPAGVNYAPIIATYNVPISFEFSGDSAFSILGVAPLISNPIYITNLEIEQDIIPNNALLAILSGNSYLEGPQGGFDELDFPSEIAGQFSELIQKNGNFAPKRY